MVHEPSTSFLSQRAEGILGIKSTMAKWNPQWKGGKPVMESPQDRTKRQVARGRGKKKISRCLSFRKGEQNRQKDIQQN
jgi:hypothetical protein